jgi:hypothetical protein
LDQAFTVLTSQKSIVCGQKGGLVLVPWLHTFPLDGAEGLWRLLKSKDFTLVPMSLGEAKKHLALGGTEALNLQLYGPSVVEKVEVQLRARPYTVT